MLEDDEQFEHELSRFENMISSGESYYFEPDSLEDIIDHYIVKNKVKDAMTAIDFGIELHPSITFFHLRKAQLYSTSGKLKESLLILQGLEKIEPGNAEVFITIASIFSQLRDHSKSIKYYEKALETEKSSGKLDADSFDIMLDLALEYENNSDFKGAIQVLEMLLKIAPDNESAIYEIAYCYEKIGDFDKCIDYYTKYIDNNPYSFTAWYNLGNIYFLKKNIEKALWAYDYAVIINENFSSAYFNMGNTYMQIEKYTDAVEAYKKCLEIDPEDDLATCYLGEAYERNNELENALLYYQKSIDLNPQLPDGYIGIGIVKDLQGKTGQAIPYFQKAISLDHENDNYHLVVGEALYKLDRFAEAELELERALQINPESTESIELLAKIKYNYNIMEPIDFLVQANEKVELSVSNNMLLVKYYWEVGQQTDALLLFKSEFEKDQKATLSAIETHFPDYKLINNFITIINNHG